MTNEVMNKTYPIINNTLQIVRKRKQRFKRGKLKIKVLSQQRQVQQMKSRLLGCRDSLFILFSAKFHLESTKLLILYTLKKLI